MTILTTFLIKGKHYSHQTESYSYAQREATKIVRRVSDDLYRATSDHHQIDANGFLFLSSTPDSTSDPPIAFDPVTGRTLWKRWIRYSYDPVQRAVYRAMIPLDTPTSDLLVVPEPAVVFADFDAVPPQDIRQMGSGVESIALVPLSPRAFTVVVKTRYNGSSADTEPTGKFAEVSLRATVRVPRQN